MADQPVPSVSDFEVTPDTPKCPKCGGPMDQGEVLCEGTFPRYDPSVAPLADSAWARSARACMSCGYIELFTSPEVLRRVMAGVKPPKPPKKGLFG